MPEMAPPQNAAETISSSVSLLSWPAVINFVIAPVSGNCNPVRTAMLVIDITKPRYITRGFRVSFNLAISLKTALDRINAGESSRNSNVAQRLHRHCNASKTCIRVCGRTK